MRVCVYITPSQLFCDEQMSIYEKTSGHQLVGKQSGVLMSSTPVKKKALIRFCSALLGTNIYVINSYYCTLRYRSRRLYTVRAKVLSYTSFLYILHPSCKTLIFLGGLKSPGFLKVFQTLSGCFFTHL